MDPINFRTNLGIHFGKVPGNGKIRTEKSENALPVADIKIPLTENNGAKHVSDVNRLQVENKNPWVTLDPKNPMLRIAGVTTNSFAYLNQNVADGLKDLAQNLEDIGTESNVESFMNSPEMKILGNLA